VRAQPVASRRRSSFYHLTLGSLEISSHGGRAIEIFPAATSPEFAAARIVLRYQNVHALESEASQTTQTFLHQTPSDSVVLLIWSNCQMINVPAASIMTA